MNKKLMISILTLCIVSIINCYGKESITEQIKDFPCYKQLEKNKELSTQFYKYMEWMSKLAPDGKLVFDYMQNKNQNIFTLAMIFHEKVEFWQWLQLGHKVNDVMTIEYYQKNYEKVYPVAHRIAVIEEINLIKFYAEKQGFKNIPEITFLLTTPIIEIYNQPVGRIFRRTKYNLEYQAQVPFITKDDIETAISIYERSGYIFKDKDKIKKAAIEFVEENKSSSVIF